MKTIHNRAVQASVPVLVLSGLLTSPLAAQQAPSHAVVQDFAPHASMRITLEEAKHRALANNKLLNIGTLNAESKAFAIKAAQSDYFPKVIGTAMYFHFNDDLGTVLTTQGRTVMGLRGRPLLTFPPTSVDAAVLNQDSSFVNVGIVQPLTDLLKVRQGVKIARADEQIAQAQVEQGMRKLASGVEQLYWGILAARRIQAGIAEDLGPAQQLAQTKILAARIALLELQQGAQEVEKQIAGLQEQLNALLDLPLCTVLELVEPPIPVVPFHCADDVVSIALVSSPEIREAQQTICKAQAALCAGKLDYVPSVALMGGYVNQTAASYIQQDIGYVGVIGSYTFIDWGKRRNVIRERQNLVAMAGLKLQQTEDEVRQKAVKAFRELNESLNALKTAEAMVQLRKEAQKQATTPEAMKNPAALLDASKDRMTAEMNFIKADLAYRQAYVELMTLIGK
jgi:outer membrane protein TolC